MPWCESETCGKRDLKKSEVVFDDVRQQVLCIPCAQAIAAATNSESLKQEVVDKTWFGVAYASDQGIKAELVHGGAKLTLKVNNEQIMRLLGQ